MLCYNNLFTKSHYCYNILWIFIYYYKTTYHFRNTFSPLQSSGWLSNNDDSLLSQSIPQ